MTKRILLTLAVCTACVTLSAGSLSAQQSSPRPSANTPIRIPVGPASTGGGVVVYPGSAAYPAATGGYATEEETGPRARLGRELGRLMTILSNNPDEEERDKATVAAEKTIAEYFDLDMQSRRQELDRVMQRAADMEATLTRREAAKEELVDLQMKSLELDANGLGLVPTVRYLAEAARNRVYSDYGSGTIEEMTELGIVAEDPRSSAREALQIACYKYQAAATENRDDAAAALREALSSYFDADMQVRRAELDEIRTELEKLEQAIDKRAEARDEIIQVELQLILNQANGLGFFGDTPWNAGEPGWPHVLYKAPANSMFVPR